ncbi:MAG: Crp/Fnr family transcriptional regulator [Magnetospirillum sp.]|nr:Crp/Fnr family transcriptional regulator [Magnetospirillum sp.]
MSVWLQVLGGLRATIVDLAPGEALFRRGDEARALYIVERGCLRLSRDGIALHRAKSGEALAEASLFTAGHHCDATAEKPSRVHAYAKGLVLLHLRAHPDLALAYAADIARQVEDLRAGQELMRLPGARDRVIASLTRQGAMNTVISLDAPLTEWAEEIGLTHEALYRTLAALVAEGRLERPGKRAFRLIPSPNKTDSSGDG